MSETPERMPSRPTGRGIKIALAVSLALNLLIVGLVVGTILSVGNWRSDPDRSPALRALGLGPFALALERDDRVALRDRLRGADLGQGQRAIGGSMRDVQRALRSDPFDRELAAAGLSRSRDAAETLQAQGHGALLDMLADMSAADRAALADRLNRALRRMGNAPRSGESR